MIFKSLIGSLFQSDRVKSISDKCIEVISSDACLVCHRKDHTIYTILC